MTSPSHPEHRLEGRTISWLTLVGLGVVLVAFATVMVGGSLRGRDAVREVSHSAQIAEAYLHAQDALARQDAAEDEFQDEGDRTARARFETSAVEFQAALDTLTRSGDARDRDLARRAERVHRLYRAGMHEVFLAVARGDEDAIERIEEDSIDGAQDDLRPLINGTGPGFALAQLTEVDDLRRSEGNELIATAVTVPLGAALYALLVVMFVHQRRRLDRLARAEVERLDEAAHTDSLTGLLNRRALHRDLALHDGAPQVMAMLDVVGLKPVNDREGHLAGDALLQGVAAALREEVRHGRAYRIGGDEFAIVLPGADERVGASVVEAVRARVAVRHPAGVRAGLASGEDATQLREDASEALLEARRTAGLSHAA